MAGQDNASCYSCEGTLLVPTVDDRVSHWRERLVSGNRMTITLKVAGQRWSSDARFLLWGENYQQEKVFEVNLRFVRGYFVRTRTWHEITSSDRRRFALNFHDSNEFTRFFEELESTLTFLKKLTKTDDTMTSSDDVSGGIVVLRVDKLPPAKPPRVGDHRPLSVEAQLTPPWDDQLVFNSNPELESRVVRHGSTEAREDVVSDAVPDDEEQTTKWYVNLYDRDIVAGPPPVPKRLDDAANVYETISDLDDYSSPAKLNESKNHEGIDTYGDELHGHSCATKPHEVISSNSFLDVGNGKPNAAQNRYPIARKPVATHVYDDRDRYDNVALDIATNSQPVPTKSKPRLPPRCNDLPTGNKPISAVANNASRQPNVTSETTTTTRPQPQPRPRKPKDDRSPSADVWRCIQCTLLNPATASRCAACDFARHGSRGVQHVTVPRDDSTDPILQRLPSSYVVPSACFSMLTANNDTWTCSVCSANNRRDAGDCHSCSAWVCGHCTLHNHPDLWICSVCSRSRLLP